MRPESCVTREVVGSVLVVRIVNPQRKNALNVDLYRGLSAGLDFADKDESIRSVIITGGNQFFCSGHDIDDFSNNPIEDESHPVFEFMLGLSQFRKPVVAAVEGFAVGIGATLLLHCDLVYAGKNSFFQMPFTSLGLCPEFAATFVIPQTAGHKIASELLILGRRFSAERFKKAGFINEITEDGHAFKLALASAMEIGDMALASVISTKSLIKSRFHADTQGSMREELGCLIELLSTENLKGRLNNKNKD
ncbi:MAG: enoyl-CoA hydratase [Oceanospirillales bacterium]|nr:enoyl-CoA hydratase [Oceanospirillales bacterium]